MHLAKLRFTPSHRVIKLIFFVVLIGQLYLINFVYAKSAASWQPVLHPQSTGISRVLLETSDGLYAGSSAGLYFSSDNAKSWRLLTDQSIVVASLTETQDKHILVGTYRYGLIKLSVRTKKWKRVGLPEAFYIWDFVHLGNTLFVSSFSKNGESGVYQSIDNGESWQATTLSENMVWSLTSPNNKHLYAGTQNGLYVSKDMGKSWAKSSDGFDQNTIVSQVVLVNNQLLAGTGVLRSPGSGIYRFDTVSKTWHKIGTGLPSQVTISKLIQKDKRLLAITQTFGETKRGLYVSSDYGDTWQIGNFDNQTSNDILLANNNNIFIATEGSGIWHSTDLENWLTVNNGIRNWDVFSLHQSEQGLLAATQNGIWRLSRASGHWIKPTLSQGANDFVLTNSEQILSTAGNNLLVAGIKSLDWKQIKLEGQYLINLYVDGNRWYALDLRGPVKYSDDSGKSWQTLALPESQPARSIVKADNGDILISNATGLFRSTDNGKTWQLENEDLYVWQFAKNKQGHLFASVTGDGMHRSFDHGKSWQGINKGFGEQPIRSAWSIIVAGDSIYIAALDRGFFQSKDNGETWQSMNEGLDGPMALSLHMTVNGKLYGGTSAGIYQWKH